MKRASLSGLALGHVDDSLLLVREALEIARARKHAFTVAWALLAAARIYRTTGRFAEGLSIGDEAIATCEQYGFVARMGTVLMQTGAAYFGLGEMERGLADSRRGLALWRKTSSRFHMSFYLSDFADCLLRAQEYEEADQAVREAEQIIAETDERSHVAEVLRLRGLLLAWRGNIADARASFWQAVEWARSRSTKLFELRASRDLARIEPTERSVNALRAIEDWFPRGLNIPDLKEARYIIEGIKRVDS